MIKFKCEYCGKKIGVKDEYAGKRAKCPGCAAPIRVPEPAGGYELDLDSIDAGPAQTRPVSIADPAEAAAVPAATNDGFHVEPGRWDDDASSKKSQAAAAAGGLAKVVIISAVVAMVAGSIWAGIAISTGYQFGFLAIIIGIAVGGTCAFVAQQQSPVIGMYAAGLTVAGILVGKVLIFNYFVPTTFLDLIGNTEDFIDDEFWLSEAVSDQMREDQAFDSDVQQFLEDMESGEAWDDYSDRKWDVLTRRQESQVNDRIAEMTDAQKSALVKEYQKKQEQEGWRSSARFAVMERMEENGEFSAEVAAYLSGDVNDVSDENLERLETLQEAELDAEMAKLSDAETIALGQAYQDQALGELGGFMDGINTIEKIKLMTDWVDLVFFAVAISAAFKVGSGGWMDA